MKHIQRLRAVTCYTRSYEETQMLHLFEDIEMPLVFTLYDMERNGIRAEGEALKVYSSQLGGRISELEKEIYEMAGESFNINSPKQLGVILFESFYFREVKRRKVVIPLRQVCWTSLHRIIRL